MWPPFFFEVIPTYGVLPYAMIFGVIPTYGVLPYAMILPYAMMYDLHNKDIHTACSQQRMYSSTTDPEGLSWLQSHTRNVAVAAK